MQTEGYDPFEKGFREVGVRSGVARDEGRGREFPVEVWHPVVGSGGAVPAGGWPLVVFSHSSGAGRTQSSFLCTHLASHGYVVAALDHSEKVAPELARRVGETEAEKTTRQAAWMEERPRDLRFLIDDVLETGGGAGLVVDVERIGACGHSFGGWTVLASAARDPRIRAVAALAPAGGSPVPPGILQAAVTFDETRDVPTLYITAEDDVSIPLASIRELCDRTPWTKQLFVLRRADHLHFMDDVEQLHETVRGMRFVGDLEWLPGAMRPIGELCAGAEAHAFVRGLVLAHLDATLRGIPPAERFMRDDLEAELARRGLDGFRHQRAP